MKLWTQFKAMPHIVHIALIVLLLVGIGALAGCATPAQSEDEVIYTPAQRAACEQEGGCITITRKALRSLVEQAIRADRRGGA